MHICFIVPPHILEEIRKNGNDRQKEWAQRSLEISRRIREKRKNFEVNEPHPNPLPESIHETSSGHGSGQALKGEEKERMIYTSNNTTDLPGSQERIEGEAPIADAAGNQAYDGTGATYDLYFNSFQRNSVDNKGLPLISTVHYSQQYDNAFWDGEQMVYGDGDGELFGLFTKPIDVTAHELTHGVTQYSANLTYENQSGALNESMSDVFGSLVKQYVLGQTSDQADWLIGEGIFTSNVSGIALRSMKAPGTAYDDPTLGKDPQPADMDHFVNTIDDNGGVHLNSGIPNHAFYLAATTIGGYAWEKAGKIWYKTLTEKLKSNSDFAECATATIETAGELFGNGGNEEKAVEEAWKRVGVL